MHAGNETQHSLQYNNPYRIPRCNTVITKCLRLQAKAEMIPQSWRL